MAVSFAVEHTRTSEYRLLPENITINPELNGRFDKPDIEPLILDILTVGQHTPVVIRNDGGAAVLVSGFSRWRAVSEINKRGLGPMALRCTAVTCNEAQAFILNISENRFRNPTTAIDDAHNIQRLLNVYQKTEDQVCAIYFPLAKTENELAEARRFVKDRISLISLVPEAEAAVRSGRVNESAAKAIAKLPSAKQREVVAKEGNIERRDVVPPAPKPPKPAPKPPKPAPKDHELLRRITAVFEDIVGDLLHDEDEQWLEVDRKLLVKLWEYVEEVKAR
jgi:ParB-like chromosome segregation protein Spo0J